MSVINELLARLQVLGAELAHDEEGQGAVEYVGIVIVVVAIIAAVAGLADGIGETIANGLRSIVEGFVGGG